jgi:beta-glucanase (GH16 family)
MSSEETTTMPTNLARIATLISPVLLAACGASDNTTAQQPELPSAWAVNVGGPAYSGIDGTDYAAEAGISGGTIGRMDIVKGSQDPDLYRTYRRGDIQVAQPLSNGAYDVTFHFAEPDQIEDRERIFDAFAEGRLVIDDLDVKGFRDGKVQSGLTVTVPGIDVADGELNIHFQASAGEPVLSALVAVPRQAPADDWQLVWQDEFDVEALDEEKWSPNIWAPRRVNDEDQAYTGREKNLRIEDGMLVIEAHKEDYEGARYTSARVHSAGKGDFLYGRFEIRAKLPRGQGSWPAIWMLPTDAFRYATNCAEGEWQGNDDCDAWPNSGEIDIMEHVGYQMNHIHGTVHNEAYYWVKWEQRKGRILMDAVDENFHVYAMEWSPERIDMFVDDAHYFTYMNEGTCWNTWPYDHPFHLILNIAVGGVWGRAGGPIDDSIFPQQMLVDYVRVYEKGD